MTANDGTMDQFDSQCLTDETLVLLFEILAKRDVEGSLGEEDIVARKGTHKLTTFKLSSHVAFLSQHDGPTQRSTIHHIPTQFLRRRRVQHNHPRLTDLSNCFAHKNIQIPAQLLHDPSTLRIR